MKELFVFYENHKVGTLQRNEDLVYSFQYDSSWLQSPEKFSLSLCLPLQEEPFGNRISLSFFENLLPEGDVKKEIEESQKVQGVFHFLEKYGKDCAGAITISTKDQAPETISALEEIEIDMDQIYQAITEKRSIAEVITRTNPGYLSLAGAQDKFPAIFRDNKMFLPASNQPTTHIIKAPIWRHRVYDSVYNEYYCMMLAKSVGLTTSTCFILEGPHPLFITERYDRKSTSDKKVHRLHQQDFCQAQGVVAEKKYEKDGGPGIKENYNIILNHVSASKRIEAIEAYFRWLCFNMIIGNNDSHSKNLSLLHHDGKLQLAPLYDLISTAVYPDLEAQFAFSIGGSFNFFSFSRKQFELLERVLKVKKGYFVKMLQEMATQIQEQTPLLAKEINETFPDQKVVDEINQKIEERIKTLENQNVIERSP